MKALLPIILLFSLVSPAKADMNCGTLAKNYIEFAEAEDDSTVEHLDAGYFLGFVYGFKVGDNQLFYNIPEQYSSEDIAYSVATYIQLDSWLQDRPMYNCVCLALNNIWPMESANTFKRKFGFEETPRRNCLDS